MPTPYAHHVGDRDPVLVLQESWREATHLASSISPDRWPRALAPGKWTLHQIVLHLAQWEMIMGLRLRCAVAFPPFTIQPHDQDPLMREASAVDGPTAFRAFLAVREMTLPFARSLSPAERATVVQHPERGAIDVEDVLTTLAGHGVHHLQQVRALLTAG